MPDYTLVRPLISLVFSITCLLLLPFPTLAADQPQTNDQVARISVIELLQLIENEPVSIVDARVSRAWKRAGNKIPGAIRLDTPEQVTQFTETTSRQQAIVLYCL